MKVSDTLVSDTEGELQNVLKDLAYNKEDVRKYFFAIQLCAEKLAQTKQYLITLTVDFANDFAVSLEVVVKKPKGWDCNFIRDGLLRICKGLSSEGLVMSVVTLRYNRHAIIEVGEDPELKTTALDFRKPQVPNKDSNYVTGNYVNV